MSDKQAIKTEHKELFDFYNNLLEEHKLTNVDFVKLLIGNSLSANDIIEIKDAVNQRIQDVRNEEMNRFIQEGRKMAQNLGIDPSVIADALTGKKVKVSQSTTATPKYKNLSNPSETWSGRGRKPAFVNEYLAADPNNKLEDLLI